MSSKQSTNLNDNQKILHDIAQKQQLNQTQNIQEDYIDTQQISDINLSLSEPINNQPINNNQSLQQNSNPNIQSNNIPIIQSKPEHTYNLNKVNFSEYLLDPILIILLFIIILHPKISSLLQIDQQLGSYGTEIDTVNLIKRGMLLIILFLGLKYTYNYYNPN